jgi:hypothetical protein
VNYALLSYEPTHGIYNLGDYIQSLAARQFLPRVDCLLNRERLGAYQGPDAKIILNGWFTHHPETWVPAPPLHPLFISFHINQSAASRILSPAGLDYLRCYAPIGCRDQDTFETLRSHGINARFTGCLTLTLSSFRVPHPAKQDIYLVDPLFNFPELGNLLLAPQRFLVALRTGEWRRLGRKARLLAELLSPDLLATARVRRHVLPSAGVTDEQKFALAERYLEEYANARLVVTSRIHCALPCLALGVPVIFLNAFDDPVDNCRFGGILDLFNRVDLGPAGKVSSNFALCGRFDGNSVLENPTRHLSLAADLRQACEAFIADEIQRPRRQTSREIPVNFSA